MTVIALNLETRLREFMLSIALEIGDEVTALVGRGDSGKRVILRSIAGVYVPDSGSITIGERTVFSSGLGVNLSPIERHVGYVPQTRALFAHLTVAENAAFPLIKGWHQPALGAGARWAGEIERRAEELLELLRLSHLADRLPVDLSPLDQQRAALARALISDPDVLLMDDPFAHLDTRVRKQARLEVVELRKLLGIPILFATTEIEEARELADRIAVIDQGRLLQVEAPDMLVAHPGGRGESGR